MPVKFTLFILMLLTTHICVPQVQPSEKKTSFESIKPNIVFILMDNLGYGEPGCYGGGIVRGAATPRIDKLASEGTRLLNYNVEAQCTPSRSALMTGRFSIRSGTHSVPIGGGLEGNDTMGNYYCRKTFSSRICHCCLWQMASR
jgi:arylsulfatase